jgi:hypothetical protein
MKGNITTEDEAERKLVTRAVSGGIGKAMYDNPALAESVSNKSTS